MRSDLISWPVMALVVAMLFSQGLANADEKPALKQAKNVSSRPDTQSANLVAAEPAANPLDLLTNFNTAKAQLNDWTTRAFSFVNQASNPAPQLHLPWPGLQYLPSSLGQLPAFLRSRSPRRSYFATAARCRRM